MAWTQNDIQIAIANEMDQSATAPTYGGTDWLIRQSAINRSLFDWAHAYDWESLKVLYNSKISTSTGNTSIALPGNFSRPDGMPRIMSDGNTAYDFPILDVSENGYYGEVDKFVNLLGNPADGFTFVVHANQLISGASVQFTYYKSPATISTQYQVAECPDPTFIVQRSLYYLYKGAEDGRFPEAKVESDRILARMIENENTKGIGEQSRSIPTYNTKLRNFRIGRD